MVFRRALILSLVLALFASAVAYGQDRGSARPRASRTGLWTGIGAGAGFGVGLWAGLTVFDDAVNSERKIWLTAIGTAVAGGVIANLLSRARSKRGTRAAEKARAKELLEAYRSRPAEADHGMTCPSIDAARMMMDLPEPRGAQSSEGMSAHKPIAGPLRRRATAVSGSAPLSHSRRLLPPESQ